MIIFQQVVINYSKLEKNKNSLENKSLFCKTGFCKLLWCNVFKLFGPTFFEYRMGLIFWWSFGPSLAGNVKILGWFKAVTYGESVWWVYFLRVLHKQPYVYRKAGYAATVQ